MIELKRLATWNGTANTTATQDNDCASPMGMLARLPKVSVPIGSLVPGFHLHASGVGAANMDSLPPLLDMNREFFRRSLDVRLARCIRQVTPRVNENVSPHWPE